MKLTINKNGYVCPVNEIDLTIFRHCSNGLSEVSLEVFDDFVEPLLFIHGVIYIDCDWRGDGDLLCPVVAKNEESGSESRLPGQKSGLESVSESQRLLENQIVAIERLAQSINDLVAQNDQVVSLLVSQALEDETINTDASLD